MTEKQMANLIHNRTDMTEEEKKALYSKGGKKSGEGRLERRKERETFKKVFKKILSSYTSFEKLGEINGDITHLAEIILDREEDVIDFNTAMAMAVMLNALHGDNRAFELIRDTIGEKPADKAETSIFADGIKFVIEDE